LQCIIQAQVQQQHRSKCRNTHEQSRECTAIKHYAGTHSTPNDTGLYTHAGKCSTVVPTASAAAAGPLTCRSSLPYPGILPCRRLPCAAHHPAAAPHSWRSRAGRCGRSRHGHLQQHTARRPISSRSSHTCVLLPSNTTQTNPHASNCCAQESSTHAQARNVPQSSL
jgi:hypothetical protein